MNLVFSWAIYAFPKREEWILPEEENEKVHSSFFLIATAFCIELSPQVYVHISTRNRVVTSPGKLHWGSHLFFGNNPRLLFFVFLSSLKLAPYIFFVDIFLVSLTSSIVIEKNISIVHATNIYIHTFSGVHTVNFHSSSYDHTNLRWRWFSPSFSSAVHCMHSVSIHSNVTYE